MILSPCFTGKIHHLVIYLFMLWKCFEGKADINPGITMRRKIHKQSAVLFCE